MTNWQDWANRELRGIENAGRLRRCVAFDGIGPVGQVNGRTLISFASNDYLGPAAHPKVRAAAHRAIDDWGTSASAARLVTGTRTLHLQLEEALARHYGLEQALLFPCGFSANLGVLTTFADADTTVFSDELNHASIIDGCRLSKAQVHIFRHLDLEHLELQLRSVRGRKIIVTESVFSMDGDAAPLGALANVAAQHDALLIIDCAHGVLDGPMPPSAAEIIRVGTLSKTLGALGGWVGGSKHLIDLLMNRARSFVYTTALTPADTAAALEALRILASEEGAQRRARLRGWIERLRPGHPSPIFPVLLGSESAAVTIAAALYEQAIHVPAIRPPTVPVGTSRLRIALSAAHDEAMIAQLERALQSVGIHP